MNQQQLVSVIMPTYNSESFLPQALESIFNQTYNNIEIIVVDDGSTDNSVSIVEEYIGKYPQIISLYRQKNQGASVARNNGITHAKGEYVAFVDSDDILIPEYFEKLISVLQTEESDLAIIGYEKFNNETGEVIYTHSVAKWKVEFVSGKAYVFHYAPWAKVMRKSLLIDNEICFGAGEILEDGPFSIMCNILADRVSIVDDIGYRYRFTSSSIQGNLYKKNSSPKLPYNAIRATIDTVRKHSKYDYNEQILEYCVVKALAGYATNMGRNMNKKTRKELCKYCYEIIKENFPQVKKNPYIKLGALKQTPLSHRIAVKMFIRAYRMRVLYPFSLIVSKFM